MSDSLLGATKRRNPAWMAHRLIVEQSCKTCAMFPTPHYIEQGIQIIIDLTMAPFEYKIDTLTRIIPLIIAEGHAESKSISFTHYFRTVGRKPWQHPVGRFLAAEREEQDRIEKEKDAQQYKADALVFEAMKGRPDPQRDEALKIINARLGRPGRVPEPTPYTERSPTDEEFKKADIQRQLIKKQLDTLQAGETL